MYICNPLAFYKFTCIMRFNGSKIIFGYVFKVFSIKYSECCLFLIYRKKNTKNEQFIRVFFPDIEGSKLL